MDIRRSIKVLYWVLCNIISLCTGDRAGYCFWWHPCVSIRAIPENYWFDIDTTDFRIVFVGYISAEEKDCSSKEKRWQTQVHRISYALKSRDKLFNLTWLRYVRVFAIAIPSVVCRSVTLVNPTQGVEPFGKISSPLCTLAILWPPCKILRR